MTRRFPQWAERLLQVAISVGVTLTGLIGWGYSKGEAAGIETSRIGVIERQITEHLSDEEHHFDREDAERLVRVEEGVNSVKATLEAFSRRGAK
jgi:hypothetical protein